MSKIRFSDGTELTLASVPRQTTEFISGARRIRCALKFAWDDAATVIAMLDYTDPMLYTQMDGTETLFERYTLNRSVVADPKNKEITLSAVQDDFADVIEAREAKEKAAREVAAAQAAQAQAQRQAAESADALAVMLGDKPIEEVSV